MYVISSFQTAFWNNSFGVDIDSKTNSETSGLTLNPSA